MQQLDMLVNRLPAPTWNRLKLNHKLIKNLQVAGSCQPVVGLQGPVCLKQAEEGCCHGPETTCGVHSRVEKMATGMGQELDQVEMGGKLRLVASEGVSRATITCKYLDGQQTADQIEIIAKDGAEITVIMTYISTASAQGTSLIRTKVLAGAGAKVNLVQVQLLGKGFRHLNDVGAELAEDADFDILQLQLGGAEIYNGVRTELVGRTSNFDAAIGYFGRSGQKLDMNFIANHYGKQTTCTMTADGVLQEKAEKTYRGTIDFKTGSSGSQGDEKETVLLLSDDVINQTVPLILCSEEDVKGNHGANIGRLDEELLFYLCSRGFSEREAVDMMAKAKIEALARNIDDEETQKLVDMYLEGVITDAD